MLQKNVKDSVINLSKYEIPTSVINVMSLDLNCHLKNRVNDNYQKLAIENLYSDIVNIAKSNKVIIENDEQLKAELKVFGLKKHKSYHSDVLSKDQYKQVRDFASKETQIIPQGCFIEGSIQAST